MGALSTSDGQSSSFTSKGNPIMFKYQTGFANELAVKWEGGNHAEVRNVIRGLKNKAQAAYIAVFVAQLIGNEEGWKFLDFMDPNK
jgi:hypothetical protein